MANLSQADIDALLDSGFSAAQPSPAPSSPADGSPPPAELKKELDRLDKSALYLTPDEKDTLGEIGNICMGASATTMYTLLGHKVMITTPRVHVYTSEEVLSVYRSPFVVVKVEYKAGVKGKNLLILREEDSMLITSLLMGEEGGPASGAVLDEFHLSAMSELMNQMIGASATSLSKMLGISIDITPPEAIRVEKDTDLGPFLDGSQLAIKVSFDLEIEGILKSELMQIMSIDMGKALAKTMMNSHEAQKDEAKAPAASMAMASAAAASAPAASQAPAAPAASVPAASAGPAYTVKVQPARYTAFDEEPEPSVSPVKVEAVSLLGDIPLQVTVELGKTKKSINDILNMGIGSVIVLDKMAGELVEVVVNGKRIARGEVVVIDENYGVRITDIVSKDEGL